MRRVPLTTTLALLAALLAPMPAVFAHGHGGHGHAGHGGGSHGGFHGGGFHHGGFHHGGFHHEFFHHHAVIAGGVAWPFAYPYYNPYYYDYPGTWTYVVPSPLYAAPLAGDCRTFQGDALIAGTSQPFYGSACLQPDGQWHIVQ